MKLHHVKKLLHCKRKPQQNEEMTNRVGDNICKCSTDAGLLSRIYEELKKPTNSTTNNPVRKWIKDMNRQLSKDGTQMAIRHIKKMFRITSHQEMQIKTIVRFYLILIRMSIILKNVGRRHPIYHWQECKVVQSLGKTVQYAQSLKIVPYDPTALLLEIYPKEMKSTYKIVICFPMFVTVQFIIAKI